jgi:hypothetical protein
MADTTSVHRCLTGHRAVSQMCICSIKVHTSEQAAPMVRVVVRGGLIASARICTVSERSTTITRFYIQIRECYFARRLGVVVPFQRHALYDAV